MRKIPVNSVRKIKKITPRLEEKVKVSISFGKNHVILRGGEVNEFLSEKIIKAVDFGFNIEDALLLKNEDFILEFLDIKNHTRRKNIRDVRARLIGTGGKARKTIENLTGAVIVVNSNMVGVIVDVDHSDAVMQGITSLVQGSKHGNVFSYLEKQNASRKLLDDDLGLKDGVLEE